MRLWSFFLLTGLCTSSLRAVIVAGANGGADNSNNTTKAQLDILVSDGHFLNNVFGMGGGNAVYIGYKDTPGGQVGYALSGMHIGSQTTLTIGGLSYDVDSRTSVSGSDLALFEFSHASNPMPSYQALTLASTTPAGGTDVVLIGTGRGRNQNATTDALVSDAVAVTSGTGYTTGSRELRWGTNQTELFGGVVPLANLNLVADPGNTPDTLVNQTIFDEPASGEWLTSNEAQAVLHDSGGGLFGTDGTLMGIIVAVGAADITEARFTNATYSADIASYKAAIDSLTGATLVPELPPWLMAGGCLLLLAGASRLRKRS